MRRRFSAGVDVDGKIEAAPPELHRAGLASETGAVAREHRDHRGQRLAQPLGRIAVIFPARRVLGERDRAFDLVGRAVEGRRQFVAIEQGDQPVMKRGDAAGVERQLLARFVARPHHDRVAAKVERQRESPAVARRGRQRREAARIGLECDMPAVIHPRRMGDADLAQHLRGQMQQGQSLVVAFGA